MDKDAKTIFQENATEHIVYKMSAILFWPQYANDAGQITMQRAFRESWCQALVSVYMIGGYEFLKLVLPRSNLWRPYMTKGTWFTLSFWCE